MRGGCNEIPEGRIAIVKALLSSLVRNIVAGFRLALFMPLARSDFRIGAEHYATLATFNVLVWCAGSFVRIGSDGVFVSSALPAMLAYIPVALLVCLIVSKLLRDDTLLLVLAVMLASTDLLFEIVGTLIYIGIEEEWTTLQVLGQTGIYGTYILWAIASVLRSVHLLVPWRMPGAKTAGVLVTVMVLALAYIPRNEPWTVVEEERDETSQPGLMHEEFFHLQGGLLPREINRLAVQRPGIADLYFLGAAPYARQDTFVRELSVVRKLMEAHFDTDNRSLALANHPSTLGALPLATATNLRTSLMQLGEIMNTEEDMLVLFVTTHGSAQHELAFDYPPLQLRQVNPTALARMLADSGIKWKIIVLSACYSGGFIEALKDDNTMIVTASDATHTSFGCEANSEFTWFSRAYFDEALRDEAKRGTFSFAGAFERARTAVAEREKAAGYEVSNPQMFVGAGMREKLKTLEARLADAARGAVVSNPR